MDDGFTPSVRLPCPVNEGEWDPPLASPQPESSKGEGVGAVVSVVRTVGGRRVLIPPRRNNDTGAASTTTAATAAAILPR